MKTKLIISSVFSFFAIFSIGCSVDTVQLIDAPESVMEEQEVEITLVNAYTHITPGGMVLTNVNRDNVHLVVGIPEDWDVVSAYAVADTNFHDRDIPEDKLRAVFESGSIESAMNFADADLLNKLMSEAATENSLDSMSNDKVNDIFTKGKTITLGVGPIASEDTLDLSQVKKWTSFTSPVNIKLSMFERSGFVFALNKEMVESFDIDPSMKGYVESTDSIGMTTVPVWIKLKLKTGKTPGKQNVVVYTKTGALPANFTIDPAKFLENDKGHFAIWDVTVGATAIASSFSKRSIQNSKTPQSILRLHQASLVTPHEKLFSLNGRSIDLRKTSGSLLLHTFTK